MLKMYSPRQGFTRSGEGAVWRDGRLEKTVILKRILKAMT